LERHHDFVCSRLLALGANRPKALADTSQLPADQQEELKTKHDAEVKAWEQSCEKRDAYIKATFVDPAARVLDEKIVMRYEYLMEIFRFIRGLVVYFFPRMIEVVSFARLIDEVLNVNASLYGAINYKKNF